MPLANPLGLLGLLGLIPIVALYLLRRRPKRRTVPSIQLYQRLTEEPSYTSILKRLMRERSLLLQILAVALAALALAGPFTTAEEPGATAVVLDGSASMTSYPDEAREAATNYVQGETTVILAGPAPIELAASASPDRARDLVNGVEFLDAEADLSAAMQLAADRGAQRIVVVSDFLGWRGRSPADAATTLESGGIDVVFQSVGTSSPNAGFVDGRLTGNGATHTLHLTVERFGGAPGSLTYTANRNGDTLETGSLQVTLDEPTTLTLTDLSPGAVTVTLSGDTGPGFDDAAYTHVPSNSETALVVGEGGTEVDALEAAGATVDVETSASSFSRYDLVVVRNYGGVDFDALRSYLESGGTVVLLAGEDTDQVPSDLLPVATGGVTTGEPELVAADTRLTDGVEIARVSVTRYLEAEARTDAAVHVSTVNDTPILATRAVGAGESIYLGLPGDDAWNDFSYRRGYPVFWANVLEGGALPGNAVTGTRVQFGESIDVQTPSGDTTTRTLFLDESGFYRWDGGELAANLFSRVESDTTERRLDASRFGPDPDREPGAGAESRTDYTPLALLALAAVLLLEIRWLGGSE